MALKVRYGGLRGGSGRGLGGKPPFGVALLSGSVRVSCARALHCGSRRGAGPCLHASNYRFRTGTDHGNPTV
jgi:hypothetical protein